VRTPSEIAATGAAWVTEAELRMLCDAAERTWQAVKAGQELLAQRNVALAQLRRHGIEEPVYDERQT
jgi:hypothetical protein